MIISIASGKGGTGKTLVATSLAFSISGKVRLLDCDVEEPDAHLFVRPVMEGARAVSTPVPVVDSGRCTLCGKCGEICQYKAIVPVGEQVLVFQELCHGCGGCREVCPEGAIQETGREIGVVEWGHRDGLEFVHGRLRVGEAMAPPLIRAVRSYARPDRVTLIDAPPGTACPVVAAMKGADFVLLVTEPTPFGLHDLKLAHGAVERLGIPCGLVINRCDLGDGRVRAYAAEQGLPVLMEIPFSRSIAEAYSRGETLVSAMPAYGEQFSRLLDRITERLGPRDSGA